MEIVLKKADIKDVFEISKLHAICWKDSYKNIVPDTYLKNIYLDDWCEEFEEGIKNKTREAHIAYIDDKPIAVVSHTNSSKIVENYGEIISLYVHPIYQGYGIGSMLLEKAIEYIKESGINNICLCVFDKNIDAIKFYEKNGFKDLGKTNIFKINDFSIEQKIYSI